MYIDIFLIVLLLWAIFNGWRNGLIKELFNTLGVLLGLIIACGLYYGLSEYLSVDGSQTNMVLSIIAFFIICFFIPLGLGFVANILTHAVKGMQLGLPNSVLGALVSFAKFLVIISFAFNIMESLGIMNETRTATSHLYAPARNVFSFVRDDSAAQLKALKEKSDTTFIYFNHKADSVPATTGETHQ